MLSLALGRRLLPPLPAPHPGRAGRGEGAGSPALRLDPRPAPSPLLHLPSSHLGSRQGMWWPCPGAPGRRVTEDAVLGDADGAHLAPLPL